jgi:hypothetical protein
MPSAPATTNSQPLILTGSLLPSLIQQLDASDVLEAYALVRSAHLHQPIFNSTIVVQKMALGLRFRPPISSHKPPLELTLEYGPQRNGENLLEDAMPFFSGDHVTWENEGQVYVTKSIGSEWTKAYYMASLTGAVLGKLLEKANSYNLEHGRYQPFSVLQHNKLVLKSSDAQDFVLSMFQTMADVGVVIKPILPPPFFTVTLHVESITKVSGYQDDGTKASTQASHFFDRMSACITAIATENYKDYTPTASPSRHISQKPSRTPSTIPSISPSRTPVAILDDKSKSSHKPSHQKSHHNSAPIPTKENNVVLNITYGHSTQTTPKPRPIREDNAATTTNNDDDTTGQRRYFHLRRLFETLQFKAETITPKTSISERLDSSNTTTTTPSPAPTIATDNSNASSTTTSIPTVIIPVPGDEATEAVKAAQEAVNAAQEAKNFSSSEASEKAANAAQAAAQAAQKAADASAQTAYHQMRGYITSGDGELVSSAIRQCFTNLLFGVADGSGSSSAPTAVAYLYLDGSFYYRLNMTEPYLSVVRQHRPMPTPPSFKRSIMNGGGDFIDWTLALAIGMAVVLGILMLLQQIGIRIFLYKSQKKFFDPHAIEKDEIELDEHMHRQLHGQGHSHGFEPDVIPWSMSGKSSSRSQHGKKTMTPASVKPASELEMVESIFHRGDPDFVDLPHLKSTSKVAVPVSLDQRTLSNLSSEHSAGRSMGGASEDEEDVLHLTNTPRSRSNGSIHSIL